MITSSVSKLCDSALAARATTLRARTARTGSATPANAEREAATGAQRVALRAGAAAARTGRQMEAVRAAISEGERAKQVPQFYFGSPQCAKTALPSVQMDGLRRVVVPAGDLAAPASSLSAYEVERAARVARNTATMAALGVTKAAAALNAPAVWRRTKPSGAGAAKRAAEAAPEPPARVSKRLRVKSGLAEPEPDGSASELDAGVEVEDERPRMLSVDEYLERKGLPKGTLPWTQPRRIRDASTRVSVAPAAPTPAQTAGVGAPSRAQRRATGLASQAAR